MDFLSYKAGCRYLSWKKGIKETKKFIIDLWGFFIMTGSQYYPYLTGQSLKKLLKRPFWTFRPQSSALISVLMLFLKVINFLPDHLKQKKYLRYLLSQKSLIVMKIMSHPKIPQFWGHFLVNLCVQSLFITQTSFFHASKV